MSDFHGYQKDQDLILCEGMTIGNGSVTPVDKATGDPSVSGAAGRLIPVGEGGMAEIRVYAHGNLSLASNKAFSISLECASTDDHDLASAPFRNSENGWLESGRMELIRKDAGDDVMAFLSGDLITAMTIPQGFLGERRLIQLRIRTDADLSVAGLDAFVHPVA